MSPLACVKSYPDFGARLLQILFILGLGGGKHFVMKGGDG